MAKQKPPDRYPAPRGAPPGFITVRQAMQSAQCTEPTIYRWIRDRLVTVVRWRHRTLIREGDLAKWNRVRKYRRKRGTAKPATSPVATLGAGNAVDRPSQTATGSVPMPGTAQAEVPASAEVSA